MNKAEAVVNRTLQGMMDERHEDVLWFHRLSTAKYQSEAIDFIVITPRGVGYLLECKQRAIERSANVVPAELTNPQQMLMNDASLQKPTSGVKVFLIARFYTKEVHGNSDDYKEVWCYFPGRVLRDENMAFSLSTASDKGWVIGGKKNGSFFGSMSTLTQLDDLPFLRS